MKGWTDHGMDKWAKGEMANEFRIKNGCMAGYIIIFKGKVGVKCAF